MKATKTQVAVAYAASICLMLTVFHRRLGLADYWEWVFDDACLVLWITFFVLRRQQKAALTATGATSSPQSPPNKKIMWLALLLIVATSLSSFLWLPYTGVVLPRTQLIITSIVSCAFAVIVFFITWKRRNQIQ